MHLDMNISGWDWVWMSAMIAFCVAPVIVFGSGTSQRLFRAHCQGMSIYSASDSGLGPPIDLAHIGPCWAEVARQAGDGGG
jgi:hypothetical protein